MIRGVFAAALTPLRDGGQKLDEEPIPAYVAFLAQGGVDGIFVAGTTGEGILLSLAERQRLTRSFLAAAAGQLDVAVHCGAQTTADTAALAADAAEAGAAAVGVIPPPYFRLDDQALYSHLAAAAAACAPVAFYAYEFAARSGYSIPLSVIERLREHVPNLRGLKVSNSPWEALEPYLLDGLDIFVGSEPLLVRALAAGAAGAVSGLASCFPDRVAALAADPSPEAGAAVERLRAELERMPFHAACKLVVQRRGVPIGLDVRAPLRGLSAAEAEALKLP